MELAGETMLDRAFVQRDATSFALSFFSWHLVHGQCPDAHEPPPGADMEAVARTAIQWVIARPAFTPDLLDPVLDSTALATQARFFWHPSYIWDFAMDEVRNLLAEELGHNLPDTWLDTDELEDTREESLAGTSA